MSIRLIALDLDGTLLDSHKNLSERNRMAIETCIAKGIHIVPCTGRTASGIPEAVRSIPGIRYAITVNGGKIEDIQTGEILDSCLLKKETALDVISLVSDRHVMYDFYIGDFTICEERFYHHMQEYKINPEIQKLLHMTRHPVPDFMEYVKQQNGGIDKVNFFFSDLKEREEIREILKRRSDILVSSSLENNLEINAPGASKGNGLLRLASILGLQQQETMACGDGGNDLSMIRLAGVGIAMENGEDEVKAMADFVTLSNDESGVAHAIEKFVLS